MHDGQCHGDLLPEDMPSAPCPPGPVLAALQAMLDGQGAADARLDGAMDEFKRMMEAQMWLPQGNAPGEGIARRADSRRGFAWPDGWLGGRHAPQHPLAQ